MKTLSLLVCLSLMPVLCMAENFSSSKTPRTGEKPLKIPIKNDGFYSIDGEEDKKSPSNFDEPEEEKVPTLDDFKGETVSGIPRLIRASPETEVFFRDINTSYIIPQSDKHNRFFHAFDQASKRNQAVSFRVDPVSRRVLAMDGVDGVRAPAKASGAVGSSSSTGGSGLPGSK